MNYWLLTLALLNVLLIAYTAFNQLGRRRAQVDDQRLTRGLQLLQNKISILQDLSDKTDEQVRRWVHLIDQKSQQVQGQIHQSDSKIEQIEAALSKALDVSKIFYEQVPQAEMIERQKTSKYVQVAKLANQGFTVEQIAQKIDLSPAEIEMIAKMNRENLQFSEESLPAWVQAAAPSADAPEDRTHEVSEFAQSIQNQQRMTQTVSSTAFDRTEPDMTSMEHIKQQFTDSLGQNSTQIPQTFIEERKAAAAASAAAETRTESGKIVRPFEFRKIVK